MHGHIGTLLHKVGDKEGRLHNGTCEAKQNKCVNNIKKKKNTLSAMKHTTSWILRNIEVYDDDTPLRDMNIHFLWR